MWNNHKKSNIGLIKFIVIYTLAVIGVVGIVTLLARHAEGAGNQTTVMVPATIGGYDTVDLLAYVAQLRAKDPSQPRPTYQQAAPEVKTAEELQATYLANNRKPVCVAGVMTFGQMYQCQIGVVEYNQAEADYVKANE